MYSYIATVPTFCIVSNSETEGGYMWNDQDTTQEDAQVESDEEPRSFGKKKKLFVSETGTVPPAAPAPHKWYRVDEGRPVGYRRSPKCAAMATRLAAHSNPLTPASANHQSYN